MNKRIFRIGTRGSPLSLIQTREVMRAFAIHHPSLKDRLEVVPMKTTGDTIVDRCLIELGGKSLFTKEIETALLKDSIDLAVHSMKDMSAEFPSGLIVPAMLEREDPRDALITREDQHLEDLSDGALFGTSSLRRQALVLQKFPHLQSVSLRGNVQTRLSKVENGEVDATLLAVAGLKRLGLLEKATQILSLEEFLPAVAQGAIGIQCREEDSDLLELLAPLNHQPTYQAVRAERAFMKALNGSCRTPIAAYGMLEGEVLFLRGMLSEPQGHNMRFVSHSGFASQAEDIGREAARLLQEKA
ncbi:MAG: hydroxymethylbilane synthase [Alphaproteobacteria bacterium 41-28]|nr:MAG: hydroxymethylbilane synthase [Alphaproteobacteria bacterium 41-28]